MDEKVIVTDLIAEIRSILDSASTSILSSDTVKVNRNDISELLTEIERSIPEDIVHAKRINDEKDRIIEDAITDKERILNDARRDAQSLLDKAQEEVERRYKESDEDIERLQEENRRYLEEFYENSGPIKEARRRADEMLQNAEAESQEIRNSAVDYATDVLEKLEIQLGNLLNEVMDNKAQL